MANATVNVDIAEMAAIINHHREMIKIHEKHPDVVRASGHDGNFHIAEHKQRIRELERLYNETWPK